MIVALTGFMGSGKSEAGKELSLLLGYRFVDLDRYIEHKTGQSVAELFAGEEDRFRALEAEAARDNFIMSRIEGFDLVISLGGGALMNPEILNLVTKESCLVWLKATPDTLSTRLEGTERERPLLAKAGIAELMEQRMPGYMSARFSIDTDGKTPGQTAQEIRNLLKL